MSIAYALEPDLPAAEFRQVLIASGLAARRPADDLTRLDRMLRNAQLILTAREKGKLVGIARAITDYAYCTYLSDLAVDAAWQRMGIGKRLIAETHKAAGNQTALLLVSAPAAEGYYPKIGLKPCAAFAIPRLK